MEHGILKCLKSAGIIFMLILFLGMTVGCRECEVTCMDLLSVGRSVFPNLDGKIYFYGGKSGHFLEDQMAEKLYDGRNPLPLSEDYALFLPADDRIFELHIYKLLSSEDADEMNEILQKRVRMLQQSEIYLYDPSGYEETINSALVCRMDQFVCLLVTTNNAEVKKQMQLLTGVAFDR